MTHLYTDEKGRLSFNAISYYLKYVAETYNLSSAVLELILEQFEGLRALYGENIPREDVLRIISKYIELTKTGYIRSPVDIVEFVESPEYMAQGEYVRPIILDHLIELHNPEKNYIEAVLGGGIGIGKNYFSDMSLAYDLYKLSCLYSPQAYYELAPGSKMIFVHQSKTEKLAKEVVFEQFGGRLDASAYFAPYFPYDPQFKKVMKFPHHIEVMPISSADTSALGMNVFGAVIDEMNFMVKIKKSKRRENMGNQEYDQAEILYTTILRRMESRFERLGKLPGKIYLISSANYENDFIDRKEKEAKDNDRIFVMHMAQWESFLNRDGTLMKKKYCGKKFFVRKPSENSAGGVFDERPEATTEEDEENILEVPIEHKRAFDRDFIGSLRDIAGIAVIKTSRFLERNYLQIAFRKYDTIYGKDGIFTTQKVELSVGSEIGDLINANLLRRISPLGPFACHIDLGISGDSAGIAIGHAIGCKDIGSRVIYNREKGLLVREDKGQLPVYGIPGVIEVTPPSGGEIELHILRSLIGLIADFIPIYYVTMDRHQSASFLQYFRRKKIASSILSLDRSPDPYMETKFAIKEERVYVIANKTLLAEMPQLDQDNTTGKIDHPMGGSKDVSDAVAGVVYTLSNKKTSYRIKHGPKRIPQIVPITKKLKAYDDRPSSGRNPLY